MCDGPTPPAVDPSTLHGRTGPSTPSHPSIGIVTSDLPRLSRVPSPGRTRSGPGGVMACRARWPTKPPHNETVPAFTLGGLLMIYTPSVTTGHLAKDDRRRSRSLRSPTDPSWSPGSRPEPVSNTRGSQSARVGRPGDRAWTGRRVGGGRNFERISPEVTRRVG